MTTKAHAELSASGSERWMNCPGSVEATRGIHRSSGRAARLGTATHALIERCLKEGKNADDFLGHECLLDAEDWATWRTPAQAKKAVPKGYSDDDRFIVDDYMVNGAQMCIDYVHEAVEAKGGKEFVGMTLEQRRDLSWIRPGMFGTNDVEVYEPYGELEIIDYKNGRIPVEVTGNTQLRYYAVGAVGKNGFREWSRVKLTIVQPNASHIDGPIRSEIVEMEELEAFAELLGVKADEARAPNAPRIAGDWCNWCEAAGTCPALKNQSALEAKADFDNLADKPPVVPSTAVVPQGLKGKALANAQKAQQRDLEDLARALRAVPMVEAWCRAVKKAGHEAAVTFGLPVEGFKVVGSFTNREWDGDEKAVTTVIKRLAKKHLKLTISDEDLYERKLKSPSKVEKLGKGMKKLLAGELDPKFTEPLTARRLKGLALAPLTDRREEIDPKAIAVADFDDLPEDDE